MRRRLGPKGYLRKWSRSAIRLLHPRHRCWSDRPWRPKRSVHRSCRLCRSWRSWRSRLLPIASRSRQMASSCLKEGMMLGGGERVRRRQCMRMSRQLVCQLSTVSAISSGTYRKRMGLQVHPRPSYLLVHYRCLPTASLHLASSLQKLARWTSNRPRPGPWCVKDHHSSTNWSYRQTR